MRLVGEKTTWLDVAKLTVNSKPVFIIYKFLFSFCWIFNLWNDRSKLNASKILYMIVTVELGTVLQ